MSAEAMAFMLNQAFVVQVHGWVGERRVAGEAAE